MKLIWEQDDGCGRAALALQAPVTHALPLDRLLLDAHPAVLSFDRVAVAGALLFSPWLSGPVELPGAVSPHVAEAVDQYCADAAVRTWPAAVNADTHFSSGRSLVVVIDAETPQPSPEHTRGEALLHVRRADRSSGSLISLDQVVVSANAYLFASAGERTTPLPVVALAVATLFAEDLGAETVRVVGQAADRTVHRPGTTDLLASVDLSLAPPPSA